MRGERFGGGGLGWDVFKEEWHLMRRLSLNVWVERTVICKQPDFDQNTSDTSLPSHFPHNYSAHTHTHTVFNSLVMHSPPFYPTVFTFSHNQPARLLANCDTVQETYFPWPLWPECVTQKLKKKVPVIFSLNQCRQTHTVQALSLALEGSWTEAIRF